MYYVIGLSQWLTSCCLPSVDIIVSVQWLVSRSFWNFRPIILGCIFTCFQTRGTKVSTRVLLVFCMWSLYCLPVFDDVSLLNSFVNSFSEKRIAIICYWYRFSRQREDIKFGSFCVFFCKLHPTVNICQMIIAFTFTVILFYTCWKLKMATKVQHLL